MVQAPPGSWPDPDPGRVPAARCAVRAGPGRRVQADHRRPGRLDPRVDHPGEWVQAARRELAPAFTDDLPPAGRNKVAQGRPGAERGANSAARPGACGGNRGGCLGRPRTRCPGRAARGTWCRCRQSRPCPAVPSLRQPAGDGVGAGPRVEAAPVGQGPTRCKTSMVQWSQTTSRRPCPHIRIAMFCAVWPMVT